MATIKGLHANLIVESLQSVFKKKKYAFFDNNKAYNVNIIGCRSDQIKANEFDDCLFLIYLSIRMALRFLFPGSIGVFTGLQSTVGNTMLFVKKMAK